MLNQMVGVKSGIIFSKLNCVIKFSQRSISPDSTVSQIHMDRQWPHDVCDCLSALNAKMQLKKLVHHICKLAKSTCHQFSFVRQSQRPVVTYMSSCTRCSWSWVMCLGKRHCTGSLFCCESTVSTVVNKNSRMYVNMKRIRGWIIFERDSTFLYLEKIVIDCL